MPKKVALITGITGQDGAYLAESCSPKATRFTASSAAPRFNTERIDHLYQDPHEPDRRLILHYGDMTDSSSLTASSSSSSPTRSTTSPRRATSAVSFEEPEYTRIPTASARCGCWRRSASSAWRRRRASTRHPPPSSTARWQEIPQKETTPFYPRSPTARRSSMPTGSR
jgi:GDPmannose 4,6-dehydratase